MEVGARDALHEVLRQGARRFAEIGRPRRGRVAQRLEIYYTPKHGSWLNMPEIKISAMIGQCLDRRLHDREKPYAVKSMLGRSEGTAKPCGWTGGSRQPTHGSK